MTKETKKKKAVGYTRVSTPRQAKKGESLLTQETAIKRYADGMGYDLLEIYSDEGISGGTVEGRPALKRLLANLDGIECLIVYRLSRLGRNSRELLNNVNDLQEAGLEIVFTEDNIDLSTSLGRAMLTILSSIAQLEREIIAETTVENKIARCKRNIPATGKIPWGRIYDKKTGEWSVDEEKKELFEKITDEYINGGSLQQICMQLPRRFQLSYFNYMTILDRSAADTWRVNFKKEQNPIEFTIPRLLSDEKIEKAKIRRKHNTTWNRKDAKNTYLLTGFLRCGVCGKALTGQTQNKSYATNPYKYYRHQEKPADKCGAFASINGTPIEQAVLEAIWDNVIDEKGFNQALPDSLPDKKDRIRLEDQITKLNSKLSLVDTQLSKLVDAVLDGTLTKETTRAKEAELLKEKAFLNSKLINHQNRLSRMADPAMLEKEARQIRTSLLDHFGSIQHFKKMDFDEKRLLLHAMFDGEDEHGSKRGIYITKLGNRKYQCFMLATAFQGVRVIFKRNLDYYNENDPEMPEYSIREKLKSRVQPEVQSNVRPVKAIRPKGAGVKGFVDVNGVRRKRKFSDNR